MNYILGKKMGMTQVFSEDGTVVPVTVVKAGPCVVTQVKNVERDGYTAVQVGHGKRNKLTKSLKGHFNNLGQFADVREFRDEAGTAQVGDEITVETFEAGEKVKVTGTTKGKGFQGVVKRHGFGGAKATHGTKDQLRMPGSIGATGPAHVFKGKKMPGRMGGGQKTVSNLEIIKVEAENNLLYIKGAVPGSRNGLVAVIGTGELKVNLNKVQADAAVEEAPQEAPAVEQNATEETSK
jgi:large subunit ribosomal protein L3